jgi:hypothetical protein
MDSKMTVQHDKCGVVLVGINKGADVKAIRTAESVKKCMPDIHITFFTDQHFKTNPPYIDKFIYIPSRSEEPCLKDANKACQGITAKMAYMHKCDYEYTIFLDYDTYVTDSLWDIFETLEDGGFDLALVQYQFHEGNTGVPDCFPYYNSGMIAWKTNDTTDAFFEYWWNKYVEINCNNGGCWDEIALQKSLYEFKNLRYLELPLEYNFRSVFPGVMGSRIKVIHGVPPQYRLKGISKLADMINGSSERVIRVLYEDAILATYATDGKFTVDEQSCERWIKR